MSMPYKDPEKARAAKRRSAKKRYWSDPKAGQERVRRTAGACEWCGEPFQGRRSQRFCGRSCSTRANQAEGKLHRPAPQFKGGRRKHVNGYYRVWVPPGTPGRPKNGYMLEHRFVMTVHLGREILPPEDVHHVNGDKADNRIENLELWSTSQPSGQRVADKIAWCVEFLNQEAPHLLA